MGSDGVAFLGRYHGPHFPADLAKLFTRGNQEQIEDILEALVSLGAWSEEDVSDMQEYLQNWLACLGIDGRSPKTRE